MSVLSCGSKKYDTGCGYVGLAHTFAGGEGGDFVPCPVCHQDWAIQVTAENFDDVVRAEKSDMARSLLLEDE